MQGAEETSESAGSSLPKSVLTFSENAGEIHCLSSNSSEEEELVSSQLESTTLRASPASSSSRASDGRPTPGLTFEERVTCERGEGTAEALPPPVNTWERCPHGRFNVRCGPDYDRNRQKAPSSAPLFEAFAVDAFATDRRVDNVSERMALPSGTDGFPHLVGFDHPYVPPYFIVQIQLPSEPPPMFLSSEDGPGWALVIFFRITQETVRQLADPSTTSNAVKLFSKWCEKAQSDADWRARFKVIASCSNLDELGIPSMVSQYNAKPILIRKTSTVFRGPTYIEECIHVHKFSYVAKQMIHLLTSSCGSMFLEAGFVIEGRSDEELPETLLGCVALNRPQQDKLPRLFS